MSIGFLLLGELRKEVLDPTGFFDALEKWIRQRSEILEPSMRREFVEGMPSLFCNFHPAAEEVEIVLKAPDQITVSANTSSVGPGYHIYLCHLLHDWTGEFGINWKNLNSDDESDFFDEAEYFFTGNKANVYEHMKRWLQALAGTFLDGALTQGTTMCMPWNVKFQSDSLAITPLGPRDITWFKGISNGSIEPKEFFPWFSEEINAEYFSKRALIQMWSSVRWRNPTNDGETALLRSVSDSLEMAYKLDPTLSLPWNEWFEILHFLNKDLAEYEFVKKKAVGPGIIGYRRSLARTQLPGYWSIEMEGSFSEFECDDDGALSSFDPPHEIWFSAFSYSSEDPAAHFEELRKDLRSEIHELIEESINYIAEANIKKKEADGKPYYVLSSTNVTLLNRSVCTIVFADPEEKDWAIRVWRSLKHPNAQANPTCIGTGE
jgi:hypothetical protein